MQQQHVVEMGTVYMMAECDHFICGSCLSDYFSALGYGTPLCTQCRHEAPQKTWQTFYGMTVVVTAIKKTQPQEVEQID